MFTTGKLLYQEYENAVNWVTFNGIKYNIRNFPPYEQLEESEKQSWEDATNYDAIKDRINLMKKINSRHNELIYDKMPTYLKLYWLTKTIIQMTYYKTISFFISLF